MIVITVYLIQEGEVGVAGHFKSLCFRSFIVIWEMPKFLVGTYVIKVEWKKNIISWILTKTKNFQKFHLNILLEVEKKLVTRIPGYDSSNLCWNVSKMMDNQNLREAELIWLLIVRRMLNPNFRFTCDFGGEMGGFIVFKMWQSWTKGSKFPNNW